MDAPLLSILLLAGLSGSGGVWLATRYLSLEAREATRRRRLLRRVGFQAGNEADAIDDKQSGLYSIGLALGPRNPRELERIRTRLGMAGFRQERYLGLFFLIKTVGGVAGWGIAGVAWLFEWLPPLVAFSIPMLLYYGPDLLVRLASAQRLGRINQGLPEFIDMCNVCISAGMGWLGAFQRVAEEMAHVYPCLSREVGYTMDQIKTGLPRTEALHQLARRNPTREMRHLVQVLIQNERQGSPVAESLRRFTERVYKEREQYMEEKAGKVSAKMALVIAPFMLLPFVILLVGEQVVNLIRSL